MKYRTVLALTLGLLAFACTPSKAKALLNAALEDTTASAESAPAAVLDASVPSSIFEVHFSPNGGCEAAVLQHIAGAKTEIHIQAYSFTSAPITEALIRAQKRGVTVNLILDKSDENGKGSLIGTLRAAGVPVEVDHKHAIAHNKVAIYDHTVVQSGSFNFTEAAEHSNAENCLFISDTALVSKYEANWNVHKAHSL